MDLGHKRKRGAADTRGPLDGKRMDGTIKLWIRGMEELKQATASGHRRNSVYPVLED